MGEAEWMSMVVAKANAHGWETYHTRDSRGSDEGFPDLVLARAPLVENVFAGRLVYVETKTDDGVPTDAQEKWRKLIVGAGGPYFLWRPKDWLTVQRVLEGTLTA